MNIYVMIANGSEEIEVITIVDLLRRAGLNVLLTSVQKEKEIIGAHNINIIADCTLFELNKLDGVIILPGGGEGALTFSENERLLTEIKLNLEQNKLVGAICASPALVLGKNNFLMGKNATCYPGLENYLKGANIENKDVVVDKNIITAKGPATSTAFALEIIKYLTNEQIESNIQKDILFK